MPPIDPSKQDAAEIVCWIALAAGALIPLALFGPKLGGLWLATIVAVLWCWPKKRGGA